MDRLTRNVLDELDRVVDTGLDGLPTETTRPVAAEPEDVGKAVFNLPDLVEKPEESA